MIRPLQIATLALTLGATSLAAQSLSPSQVRQAAYAEAAQIEANAAREAHALVPDLQGTGPFPAIKEELADLPDHTIYRPQNLATLGPQKLGVVIWGNGGCSNDGASARMHLLELASHGYIAIAPGAIRSGPNVSQPPSTEKTTTQDVLAGLDWALTENERAGSPLFGLIDPTAVAVAGHSCGGLQALLAAPDPRIAAVLIHNSGTFVGNNQPVDGLFIEKSQLEKLHTPVLYVLGGPSDIAYPNGTDDFRRINHTPAMLVDLNVGHGGTFRALNGGRVAQISVDWLEWQLRDDEVAGRTFTGTSCRLCLATDLRVERKMID